MFEGKIDAVFVGSDRIARNGDVCNKIGTYSVAQLAAQHDFVIVFTQTSPTILHQLEQGGILKDVARARVFNELDRGLEWCEDQLLEQAGLSLVDHPVPLESFLERLATGPDGVAELLPYFERLDLPAEHCLMRQGDPPDAVFYVESGRVKVQVDIDDARDKVRVHESRRERWKREQEQKAGRTTIFTVDTELDEIMNSYKMTFMNLANRLMREHMDERMELDTLIRSVLTLPGERGVTRTTETIRIYRQPRDPRAMEAVERACAKAESIVLDELPKGPTHKVEKHKLRHRTRGSSIVDLET